jgi:hypothetical protein
MDKDTTPAEPRLDEDLTVEDESAEQVAGGHLVAPRFKVSRARASHLEAITES